MLLNFTERVKSQRLNVKFTQQEHDQIVQKGNIKDRVSLAVEYDQQGKILTFWPSNTRGSNILSRAGGNWAYIVSFDGFQRRAEEIFLTGKNLHVELRLNEKCEIKVPIGELVRNSKTNLQKALDLINQAIKDGTPIEIIRGQLTTRA